MRSLSHADDAEVTVGGGPRFLGLADYSPQFLVGEGELVGQLAGLIGLVLELAGLILEEAIALFEGNHARSRRLALARDPHSTNYRVDL